MIEAEENKQMIESELHDLERGIELHEQAELDFITARMEAQARRQEVMQSVRAELQRDRERRRRLPNAAGIQVNMKDEGEPAPQAPIVDLTNYDGRHAKELASLREQERVASVNYLNIGRRLQALRSRRDQLKAALQSLLLESGEGSSGD